MIDLRVYYSLARHFRLRRRRRALRALIDSGEIYNISLLDGREEDIFFLTFLMKNGGDLSIKWGGEFRDIMVWSGGSIVWSSKKGSAQSVPPVPPIPAKLEQILKGYLTDASALARLVKPLLHRRPQRKGTLIEEWDLQTPPPVSEQGSAKRQAPASGPPKTSHEAPKTQKVAVEFVVTVTEAKFKQVFFNKTENDRNRIIQYWMEKKRCGRDEAMNYAVEELMRDQRSWR